MLRLRREPHCQLSGMCKMERDEGGPCKAGTDQNLPLRSRSWPFCHGKDGPSAEQQSLGGGWNHVVRGGGGVVKAAPTPKPKTPPKPVTTPPTEDHVPGSVKGAEKEACAQS